MFPFGRRRRAQGAPSGPPPNYTPTKGKKVEQPQESNEIKKGYGPGQGQGPNVPKAVDPGVLYPCLFQYVYIWPRRGEGFWAYLVYVGPRSVAGWRYDRGRWFYFGMDLRSIDEFYCA